MRALLLGALCTTAATALPTAPATLTLANAANVNKLTVTVDPGLFADTDTTTLSGTLQGVFDIDPATGAVSRFTITGGRMAATNMQFSGGFGAFGYNVTSSGLSFTARTEPPPGVVNPANGQFDAAQHEMVLDQGSVSGTALGSPVNSTFTPANPATGRGEGTGTIALAAAGDSGPYRRYTVTITLPVNLDTTVDPNGTPIALTAIGTLKASGTVEVPRTAYLAWTIQEGIPGAGFESVSGGLAHGLRWALGLHATGSTGAALPHYLPDRSAAFTVPATAAPLLIERSTDLQTWTAVPAARINPGANPLPAGSTGAITLSPAGSAREFLRLRATEP